nr:hypothetical protein [Bradyrhizobium zhanjiangense]
MGVPVASPVTIEAIGSTSVVVSGGNYYLDNISTGTGPTLKYQGNVVNTANYTTWSVIAAEQVSGGGYDVVWKDSSNGHYSVWSTDSSGNFVTTLAAAPEVLGTDPSLKALEPTLQQDLNGDGAVGAAPLAADGSVFNFNDNSLSSPPEAPDPMPGWVGAEVTPSPSGPAEAVVNHDASVPVSPVDLLHDLHHSGLLLA